MDWNPNGTGSPSAAERLYTATALLPLAAFLFFASRIPSSVAGTVHRFTAPWVPGLGVELAFTLDGLSLLFCLVITGIGTLIAVYGAAYLGGSTYRLRFYLLFYLFMAAMVGLVLADDLVVMFVFWETTTIVSYLLIGFDHDAQGTRYHARQALLVTGAGGLCLLVGILLIGGVAGTYSLTDLKVLSIAAIDWEGHGLYPYILGAFLLGAFTKSAQFPFHFWLPNAMSAPTPISAFLHSATMVKAGVYLLARLHPVLGGTTAWMAALVVTGAVTALIGSVLAMGQRDLKRVLAYTTVMALGIITMFLGGPTTPTLTAAVTFLLVHALYKSALFLVVGSIDHEAGTRRLDRLGGLARTMPLTAAGAAAAALSMAGFPLFLGFVGKEIMYKGALTEEMFAGFATTAALLSNALMTAVAGVILIRVFLSGRVRSGRDVHEAPPAMWIGPLLLGGLGLVFGIIPEWVGTHLVEPAVYAIHSTTEDIQLKLWHGVNMPLLLSVATLTLGGLIYGLRERIRDGLERVGGALPWSLDRLYGAGMDGLAAVAAGVTRRIQTGSLSAYLTTVFFAFIAAAGYGAVRHGLPEALPGLRDVGSVEGLVALAMILAAVVVVSTASRLLAVCGLGVVGAGAAVFFLVSGAPDVAMTQLLVETLTLVIVAMVLLRLPHLDRASMRRRPGRGKDLLTAVLAGALVGGLLLAVTAVDLDRSLTAFYENRSAAAAHGRNIVNVILVDFRGLDTLGEITVVAAAGLAAVALIRGSRRRAP